MGDLALILSADKYTLTDEKTGEVKELFQVWYCNDYRESSDVAVGCKPIKMVTTPEIFEQLKSVELPALYDMQLRSRPGKANAAALTVVGITYVSTPPLFPKAQPVAMPKQAKAA